MTTTYLDNAATSFPKAPGVAEAVCGYITGVGANVNRGSYASAGEAARAVLETRRLLKTLFSFPYEESHVVLIPGATFGLNLLLCGYLRAGDHVIVSGLEHNAVMRPLAQLASHGIRFTRAPADEHGFTDPACLPALFCGQTRLMLVSHASNVCGTLFPVKEAAALCRARGVPFALDAAQTAGHVPIDYAGLGLSALCVPGHKGLLGPQGVGALLLSPAFAAGLSPIVTGGTGSESDLERQPDFLPDRFEPGTPNLPGIYGLRAALSYLLNIGVDALCREELALAARFLSGIEALAADARVRVAGLSRTEGRVGVVSLDFPGRDNAAVAYRLEREHGILTRCGLHCAPSAHRALGTFPHGTVRFSFGHGNTPADADRAAEAVMRILK